MRGKILTFSTVQFFLQACMDKKELPQYNPLHTVKYSALPGGKNLELPYWRLLGYWRMVHSVRCTANNAHTGEDLVQ